MFIFGTFYSAETEFDQKLGSFSVIGLIFIHIYSIIVIYDYSSIFVFALRKLLYVLKMTKVQFIFVFRHSLLSFSIQTEWKIKLSPWLLLLSRVFIWFLRMREPARWPLQHEGQTQNWFCLLSLPFGTQVDESLMMGTSTKIKKSIECVCSWSGGLCSVRSTACYMQIRVMWVMVGSSRLMLCVGRCQLPLSSVESPK